MTLVLSVHSKSTFWLLADRRLSRSGQPWRDDAIKVMTLETTDGVAVLGYAGLGMTPRGTQPSSWMSALLRGRGGLTVEQSLGLVSAAANKELPRYLPGLGGPHTVIAPAFIKGVGPELFTIDNVFDQSTHRYGYGFNRQVVSGPSIRPVRVALAGSGAAHLLKATGTWVRPLLRLVKQHDLGKVSEYAVADRLAALNYGTHLAVPDGSVGPRCLVVWRRRPDARRRPSTGSAHQCYSKTARESENISIPSIANGTDMHALIDALFPASKVQSVLAGGSMDFTPSEEEERRQRLSALPETPDERLR